MTRTKLYFDINQLPTVLTLREAAIYLRCSETVLKSEARKGSFPAYKLTDSPRSVWHVDREDLLAYKTRRKGVRA